jgi:MFS family permease
VTVAEQEKAAGFEPAAPSASTLARWYVLLVMCLVYTISIADRYVISTVLEPIRIELALSDSQVAFLTGVSLALFYVSFGIPLSMLADRVSRRNIITVSLIIWSGLTVLTGLTRTYWQLMVARIGVGIGEAGGTPAANSIISDYFPARRRPMALTIFSLGAPLGAWVAYAVAGPIVDHYGWRAVFLALGVPGILFGALLYLTVREPRRGQLDQADDSAPPSLIETLRFLWGQRSAVHLMVAGAITAFWGWGLTFWTPTFLQRTYGMTAGRAGEITGPMHLVAGIGATVLTGWLVGLPAMREPRRVAWLMGGGIGLATIPSIILVWTHDLGTAELMLWLFVPSIYFYIGPSFGLLNNLAPPRMRAQFCAVTLLIANIGNLVLAPQLVGLLSDWFAPESAANADSLRLALLCLVPTGFWAAYHFFACASRLEQDHARAVGGAD